MSNSLRHNPECDIPVYPVVLACRELGFDRPEDVRWRHRGYFLEGCLDEAETGHRRPNKHLWMGHQRHPHTCPCGAPLPTLDWYSFDFLSGEKTELLIGQCRRCRTIYWDVA